MKTVMRTAMLAALFATSAGAEESGYSRAAYYAPMSDGVSLAITVYTPKAAGPAARFPVILWYLPGHRESIDPKSGKLTSAFPEDELRFFTSHGYAMAVAEMRGSGASFGSRELDRGPQIGRDGKQLVDWIAGQPWSDGTLGMVGASYQGFSQYATAAERPAALRAIFDDPPSRAGTARGERRADAGVRGALAREPGLKIGRAHV